MVNHGIDASRIEFKGYGEENLLISPEVTDEDFEKNRRVEFAIIDIDSSKEGEQKLEIKTSK